MARNNYKVTNLDHRVNSITWQGTNKYHRVTSKDDSVTSKHDGITCKDHPVMILRKNIFSSRAKTRNYKPLDSQHVLLNLVLFYNTLPIKNSTYSVYCYFVAVFPI